MPENARSFKSAIYEQLARIGKAVSSPKRLELLDLLCQGERTVEVLAKEAALSIATTSHHLQILRAARLVGAEKEGLYVTYRVAAQNVSEFVLTLRGLAENRLAEISEITRRFLANREGMEPVRRETLLDRVRRGAVSVLDVRPVEEYRAGHLPGAISVPLKELERRLAEIPKHRPVVAYCRGPYCVLAIRAVELLRQHGYRATRLEDGIPDWRGHGLPVETGEASTEVRRARRLP